MCCTLIMIPFSASCIIITPIDSSSCLCCKSHWISSPIQPLRMNRLKVLDVLFWTVVEKRDVVDDVALDSLQVRAAVTDDINF